MTLVLNDKLNEKNNVKIEVLRKRNLFELLQILSIDLFVGYFLLCCLITFSSYYSTKEREITIYV